MVMMCVYIPVEFGGEFVMFLVLVGRMSAMVVMGGRMTVSAIVFESVIHIVITRKMAGALSFF